MGSREAFRVILTSLTALECHAGYSFYISLTEALLLTGWEMPMTLRDFGQMKTVPEPQRQLSLFSTTITQGGLLYLLQFPEPLE